MNCLHPGVVQTKTLSAGWGDFGMSANQADDLYFLATDPSVEGITGEYFDAKMVRSPPAIARSQDIQERVMAILQQQTGQVLDASKAPRKL